MQIFLWPRPCWWMVHSCFDHIKAHFAVSHFFKVIFNWLLGVMVMMVMVAMMVVTVLMLVMMMMVMLVVFIAVWAFRAGTWSPLSEARPELPPSCWAYAAYSTRISQKNVSKANIDNIATNFAKQFMNKASNRDYPFSKELWRKTGKLWQQYTHPDVMIYLLIRNLRKIAFVSKFSKNSKKS